MAGRFGDISPPGLPPTRLPEVPLADPLTRSTTPPHLVTLGRLALVDGKGRPLVSAGSGKLLGLVAYLAARPGRRATRDQLIDLFWADSRVDKGRNSLRQALHILRSALGDAVFAGDGGGDVVLTSEITTDRDGFLAALEAGDFDAALQRYTGPFAPGLVSAGSATFEHWAENERDRLHDHFVAAAEAVARRLIAAGDPRGARALAQRLLDSSALDERAWRLRLEAEMATGSRVHVAASVAELQRDLALANRQPEPRTRQLIDRLTHATVTASDDDGRPLLVADLVGREREFGQLYDGWRDAVARRATHLHVSAPAGVGKTRLLDDFAFRLEADRARVARVRATPRQRTAPGSVLAALVSALAELPGATGVADRSADILVDVQPAIAGRFPRALPLAATYADERRRMRTEALVDLLGALADDGPLCLLVDDLHWWDGYSRDIVCNAVERMDGKPLLVVTASRPGPGEVAMSITAGAIALHALDERQVAALLTSLGDTPDANATCRLATGLHAATDGVPLLVLDAVRLGLDRAMLRLDEARWDFVHLDDYLASLSPGGVLAARIAALAPGHRRLLLLAAVIEQPIGESAAATLDVDAPGGTLMDLERLGMLAKHGDGWVTAHDVIAQVAVETATPAEIRCAHGSAGMLLAAAAGSRAEFAEVVRHYLDAGDSVRLADILAEWVRRRRAGGDDRSGAVIVRELFGSNAGADVVGAAVRSLPLRLRQRPWRKHLPWAVAVGAIVLVLGAAWWTRSGAAPPDAVVGILTGPPEQTTQLVVPLYAAQWSRVEGELATEPATAVANRFRGNTQAINDGPVLAPDARRWLVSRTVAGRLGPTELYLVDARGVERPVAPAPGDDVAPDWSPDGQSAVFATTRWPRPGNATFDLAILDLSTGAVRRLTSDTGSEETPRWSPTGTRIAFVRRPAVLAPDELCWIAVDGVREECRSVAAGIHAVLGWLDSRTVLVTQPAGRGEALVSMPIDRSGGTVLFTGRFDRPSVSPDGDWVLCVGAVPAAPNGPKRLMIFPVHRPEAHREIRGVSSSAWLNAFWSGGVRRPWLTRVQVVRPPDTVAVDASFRMSVTGTASNGTRLDPVDAVLAWSSSDTTTAAVDAVSGDLQPRRAGTTWITVSAGGWQHDSVRVVIGPPAATPLFHEDWSGGWQDRWLVQGPDPMPAVVTSREVRRGITPNGNGTYADYAYTRQRFDATAGIGVDAIVQAPITRSKWQAIRLGIMRIDRLVESGPLGAGCSASIPAGEGWSNLHLLGTSGGPVTVSDPLVKGTPFRLRIQLFPDGSCGTAIDGRPIDRTRVGAPTDQPVAIVVLGQSVGTRMLVGPLNVWRGVRGDVDWSALGRDTTAQPAAAPPRKP